ncbi:MAG: hypothetical protein ABWZ76_00790 [Acidimicrobiales bacterium]
MRRISFNDGWMVRPKANRFAERAGTAPEEPFTDGGCRTFLGRALAVVRPTGAGSITLTATAEVCQPQHVRIDAR